MCLTIDRPEPGAAEALRARRVGAVEALEDVRQVALGDAGPVVGDGQHDRVALAPHRRPWSSPRAGVLDRVLHQVAHDDAGHPLGERHVGVLAERPRDSTAPCSAATADSSWTVSAAAAARSLRERGRQRRCVASSSERNRMSVISASRRSVSLVARRTKSRCVSASICGSSSASSSAAQAGEGRAQLVRDVGDELRAQLLVVGRLAGVGQEDQRLRLPADLVGRHRHPVGAAAVREEAHLEASRARGSSRARLDPLGEAVLAERLEHAHARHEEREALEGEEVRLDEAAARRRRGSAVNGRSWKRLAAAALGVLGVADRARPPRAGGGGRRAPRSAGGPPRGRRRRRGRRAPAPGGRSSRARVSQTPRTATGALSATRRRVIGFARDEQTPGDRDRSPRRPSPRRARRPARPSRSLPPREPAEDRRGGPRRRLPAGRRRRRPGGARRPRRRLAAGRRWRRCSPAGRPSRAGR